MFVVYALAYYIQRPRLVGGALETTEKTSAIPLALQLRILVPKYVKNEVYKKSISLYKPRDSPANLQYRVKSNFRTH